MGQGPLVQPLDEYNKSLLRNVHPTDWINPEPAACYNLVVIGAGTAGLVSAAGAAGLGAKVALIERGLLGGDCLNLGCVPSKGIIRASRQCMISRQRKSSERVAERIFPSTSEKPWCGFGLASAIMTPLRDSTKNSASMSFSVQASLSIRIASRSRR